MHNRLGVRERLSLLLMLPLIALVVAVVPLTAGRLDAARSADRGAGEVRAVQRIAGLVRQLQRERLLGLGYLGDAGVDRAALLAQQEASTVAAEQLSTVVAAVPAVAALASVRGRVLARAEAPRQVFGAYRDAIAALLATLHPPAGADRAGLRRGFALDTLLRADEQAAGVGAALLVAAVDPAGGTPLLVAAAAAQQQAADLFAELASDDQRAVFDQVTGGAVAGRLAALTAAASGGQPFDAAAALAAARSYASLREFVENEVLDATVTRAAAGARDARAVAAAVIATAAGVLILLLVACVRVGRSVTARLRRLNRAVGAVADMAGAELVRLDADESAAPPRLVAVDMRGDDELAELAAAFNRVQATAVLLLERQVNTRRNVATMFTNIARRTQHLVGRQLSLLDDMERDERDADLLEKFYRLDHIATRLGRSADSLLVVAGTREDSLSSPTPLVEVIRAGMGEIEGFRAVRLGSVCDAVIGPQLTADLRLLLAELLENAASFSPPGVLVDVGADIDDGACRIAVVDHGIGMPAAKLAEENRRMLELQRLEEAPTQFLGLFVVGRLARRHGLTVRLTPTSDGGITATVTLPPSLFTAGTARSGAPARAVASIGHLDPPTAAPLPAVPAYATADTAAVHDTVSAALQMVASRAPEAFSDATVDPSFTWFRPEPTDPAPAPRATAQGVARVPGRSDPDRRGDLRRRVPGQSTAAFGPAPVEPESTPTWRDAAAEAAQLDAFSHGAMQAATDSAAPPHPPAAGVASGEGEGRGGLQRRVPGAHLSETVLPARRPGAQRFPPADAHESAPRPRDPAAERTAFDDYVAGLARAAQDLPTHDARPQE